MKRILFLGAGPYHRGAIKQLREAGYFIIAIDKNANAPARWEANEFYPIDIVDKNAVLKLAKSVGIDGIMHVNEFGSRTASFVAGALAFNGYSIETVEATNDKGLMRDKWTKSGLNIPRYFVFEKQAEITNVSNKVGFPCVLKPTDSGGSGRGVSVLKSEADIPWAFNFAKDYARNGRFIIEQFIDGIELTVETFSIDGQVYFLAISDKIKPDLRTRVALSLNYPALLSPHSMAKVKVQVAEALKSLGVSNGICHTELIVDQDGIPFLIETGARGGGGHVFHTIIKAVSGVDGLLMQAKWLTGGKVEINEICSRGCCYRFFNPPAGILKGVRNLEIAREIPGVIDIGIDKQIGEVVGNLENSLHRTGFVVTIGSTREEAMEIADKVEKTLIFEIEPISER